MVSVEFRSVAPGTCSWCGKEKNEVFTVVFSDRTFDGPVDLCWADFRYATRLKVAAAEKKTMARPTPGSDGDA
jgi:hypothetical protein